MKNFLLLTLLGISPVSAMDGFLYSDIGSDSSEERVIFNEYQAINKDILALKAIGGVVIHISENKAVTDADFIGAFNAINTWYGIHCRHETGFYGSPKEQFSALINRIPEMVLVDKDISELCGIYDNYIADIGGFSEASKYVVNSLNRQAKLLANEEIYGTAIALGNMSNCINSDITFRCIFGKIISDKGHPFCRFLTNFVKF